jgi:Transposase DDE domain
MRSRSDYIVTKEEVYGYANHWLGSALRLEYEGTKCTASTLLQILLIAAARVASIFAVCRDLADAPSDQTIRNALAGSLPEIPELERRLNRALCTKLPKALGHKARMIAIDLVLIPYHGSPESDQKEIYRGHPKSGTTHFHAYATVIVLHKGHRYTLGVMRVERGVAMKEVVQRLVHLVRRRGIRIKFLLLDKGFFSVDVLGYLKRAGYGFIIPAVPRGRKPKPPKKPTGLRALLKKEDGYYRHTLTASAGRERRSVDLAICVATKHYTHRKTGRRRKKKLLYAVWKVRLTPDDIRETYRKRFGIETSYRQMNEARIRTSTRSPRERLLFIGIALVLRNVWVWLHFKLAKAKWSEEPRLFLELLRFREMLLWIAQTVGRLLGADRNPGIDRETYERLAATR